MNWSIYNYVKQCGEYYRIYNTSTRGIIDIDVVSYHHIENSFNKANVDEEVKNTISMLIDQGYIYSKDNEWLDFYQQREKDYKKLSGKFVLYYVPSWECDFRCPYCHYFKTIQDKSASPTADIAQSARFAAQYIKGIYSGTQNPISLSVILYGGEPLLALESHLNFLSILNKELDGSNVLLSVSVITNGYNLSDDAIESLKKWNLKGMQITVDGIPDIHNKRRIHKNGYRTFDIIVNNIKKLCMEHGVPVTVRINVDEENVSTVPALLKYLRVYGITRNMILSVSPVFSNSNLKGALNDQLVLRGFENIYQVAADLNYPFVFPTTACSYYSPEFLVIGNNKAYSCPSMSANDINAIASVYETAHIIDQKFQIQDNCKKCLWLPLCGAGCKYQNLKSGKTECMALTYKLIVESYMMKYANINRLIKG